MSNAMNQHVTPEWETSGELEALTFNLNDETFALEASIVREILDHLPETLVPGGPTLVGGVINFRGKVIPLADLRLAFGIDVSESTIDSRIIVIELEFDGEPTLVGVRADKVNEVTALAHGSTEQPPSLGMRYQPEYIRCFVKHANGLVILPDLYSIFANQQGDHGVVGDPSRVRH
jgi:purine-binding chemotaxis protein CheW